VTRTQAQKAFEQERVPFTFDGVEFEALEPSLALRVALSKEAGLAADLPLVAAVVVLPGTREQVFPKPSDVLESSGSKAARLIEQVKGICARWEPPKPQPKKVDTTPMEVPESAKAAADAIARGEQPKP